MCLSSRSSYIHRTCLIVLPHKDGLDFMTTMEKEHELVDEVDQLRKRLDEVRSHPYSHIFTRITVFLTASYHDPYTLKHAGLNALKCVYLCLTHS